MTRLRKMISQIWYRSFVFSSFAIFPIMKPISSAARSRSASNASSMRFCSPSSSWIVSAIVPTRSTLCPSSTSVSSCSFRRSCATACSLRMNSVFACSMGVLAP